MGGRDLYDAFSAEDLPSYEGNRISQISIVEDGYVIEKDFCLNCGSIDIGVSQKGNKYCKKICLKK